MGQISECSRKLKRSIQDSLSDSYADVVRHVTDQSWQEERESLLQSALKRWLVVVIFMRFCEPHTGKTKTIEICILSSFNPHYLTSFNLHPVS